jgi:hypothetical protein
MDGSANVNSLEALHDWYAALCVFRTEAMESLSSVSLEIQRADNWLDEQLRSWQQAARDAEEDVVRYKAELANRRHVNFAGRVPDCTVQQENLQNAEDRLQYARDQIEVVRRWFHRMPKMIDEEYTGPARRFMNLLEGDLPRGLAMLKGQIASLEAYLNIQSERVAQAPPPETAKGSP